MSFISNSYPAISKTLEEIYAESEDETLEEEKHESEKCKLNPESNSTVNRSKKNLKMSQKSKKITKEKNVEKEVKRFDYNRRIFTDLFMNRRSGYCLLSTKIIVKSNVNEAP